METLRTVVHADGALGVHSAKTAVCLLRFRPQDVVAILDHDHAGRTTGEVLGLGGDTPILARLADALDLHPTRLLIGTHPAGGHLDPPTRSVILEAIELGLEVACGLHDELRSDPEIAQSAARRGVHLLDLRAVPPDLDVPRGTRAALGIPVILTVGTDCNVGKMTAAWILAETLQARGVRARFVPSGQTGVLLAGGGFAVDRVVGDFLAGATERLLEEHADGADLLLLEGQGSVIHPFYSGVTLGMLHGAEPDAMILCHVAGRTELRHSHHRPVPPLPDIIQTYESLTRWTRPAEVLGVALATHELEEDAARTELTTCARELALPVEDVVRFPTGELATALARRRP